MKKLTDEMYEILNDIADPTIIRGELIETRTAIIELIKKKMLSADEIETAILSFITTVKGKQGIVFILKPLATAIHTEQEKRLEGE